MAIFENPNEPKQPQKGVYIWYAIKDSAELPLYIGQAGRKISVIKKGTLFRGVSELQRCTFSSNSPSYNTLDTDFIVGTAIKFFEEKGYQCTWRHVSNNPDEENNYVDQMKPFLQMQFKPMIEERFRLRRQNNYWKLDRADIESRRNKVLEAEKALFHELEIALDEKNGSGGI
jgi:hypothetical protein